MISKQTLYHVYANPMIALTNSGHHFLSTRTTLVITSNLLTLNTMSEVM